MIKFKWISWWVVNVIWYLHYCDATGAISRPKAYRFKNVGFLCPLLLTWFNFNPAPAWISNYIHYKVWDEITYQFLNFNGATVDDVIMLQSDPIYHCNMYSTAMTGTEHKSDTFYDTLTDELLGVYNEYFRVKMLRYNDTALYWVFSLSDVAEKVMDKCITLSEIPQKHDDPHLQLLRRRRKWKPQMMMKFDFKYLDERLCMYGSAKLDILNGKIHRIWDPKAFLARNLSPVKIIFALNTILMIQTGHTFAVVTTAELSWHMLNFVLICSLFLKKGQHKEIDYQLINWLKYGLRFSTAVKDIWRSMIQWNVIFGMTKIWI